MKSLVAVILLAVVRLHADELPWQFEYNKALEEAKAAHKSVLLDFSASWCGPCQMMEKTTFADQQVQSAMTACVLLKVDIDRDPMLAARYKVDAVPTTIMLNQFGELVDRRMGYAPVEAFTKWLAACASSPTAKAKEAKSEALARGIKQLNQALELPDAAARDKAVAALLTIYCTPETNPTEAEDDKSSGAKLVQTALSDLVEHHPAWAAPYLNEPRLAVRILFTTLFAAKVGADFQFDPWAPSATRATAASEWARRLEDR